MKPASWLGAPPALLTHPLCATKYEAGRVSNNCTGALPALVSCG
jgi:hypothetical protein